MEKITNVLLAILLNLEIKSPHLVFALKGISIFLALLLTILSVRDAITLALTVHRIKPTPA